MRANPPLRILGVLATAGALLVLAGCSGLQQPVRAAAPAAVVQSGEGVELVVGVHANGLTPDLSASARAAVAAAIQGEQSVGVVAVDGRPWELQRALPMSVTGETADARAAANRRNAAAVLAEVRTARARAAGSDLFSALLVAARAARGAITPVKHLIVLDNGLADRGPLDLTVAGMTDATPSIVAGRLVKTHALAPDAFAGLTVDFTGLGSAVAPPQRPLSTTRVANIRAIYSAVVKAGGGTAVISTDRVSGAPASAALPVAAVGGADDRIRLGGSSVLGDGSSIGFLPGTASFRDPAAARALLEPLATWLRSAGGRRADVVGRTSSEGSATRAQDLALSTRRADAVRDLLVALGASASAITARGEGYVADPPDTVHGVLDPAKAAQNRVVRITTRG